RLVAKLTCGGLARLFVTNFDKNFDSSVATIINFYLCLPQIHRNSTSLLISQQVYCEEREARRGNLYKTRNAPFYIEIAASDALRVLLAASLMTSSNAVCPLPSHDNL
ncbi:MAG: hypothetical protein LBK69_02540, partial [Syntrophomonadaceae bacterium]|nr:hypothetical protein [Syntrophomonadaceae bacterium]